MPFAASGAARIPVRRSGVSMSRRVVFRLVLTLWVLTLVLLFIVHFALRPSLPQPLLDYVQAQDEADLPGVELALGAAWLLLFSVALVGLYAFWRPARVLWLAALALTGPFLAPS